MTTSSGLWRSTAASRYAYMVAALACGVVLGFAGASQAQQDREEPWRGLVRLVASVEPHWEKLSESEVRQQVDALDAWAAELAWQSTPDQPQQVLTRMQRLLEAQAAVDQLLTRLLAARTAFAASAHGAGELLPEPAPEGLVPRMRAYLVTVSLIIDASGRLRYTLRDAVDNASYELDPHLPLLLKLLDSLTQSRSGVAAEVLAFALHDPPADSGFQSFPLEIKRRVLKLIHSAGERSLLGELAEFLRRGTPTYLRLDAAEIAWELGLSQDPLPGQDETPPLTASRALELLESIPEATLPAGRRNAEWYQRYQRLRAELVRRRDQGVGATFELGGRELTAGDWILIRNPSPYNRFTELSPGLFTHVGIVAQHVVGGRQHLVVVDLPERGDKVPATNVEDYLDRTLHYAVLRHADSAVNRQMSEAARKLIGHPTQFDLTFRTQRLLPLADRLPAAEEPVHTYCAGFLLLCALQTDAPRHDFFPFAERPAGGRCGDNLAQLGMEIGDRFVSPTGPLFAGGLRLVATRRPMYDPTREIKEAVYDYFADCMVQQPLVPSPDMRQQLIQRIATLSESYPWLGRALARSQGVSARLDLESAAKAAAVVETLDEIAETAMDEFLVASEAILAGTVAEQQEAGLNAEQRDQIARLQRRHPELTAQWQQNRLSPRALRVALVDYYNRRGREMLAERFFPNALELNPAPRPR